VEGVRGRIFRSGNRTGRNKDGGRKGEGCVRLANTQVCQGCAKIPRTGELLSLIHRGVYIYSQTSA